MTKNRETHGKTVRVGRSAFVTRIAWSIKNRLTSREYLTINETKFSFPVVAEF